MGLGTGKTPPPGTHRIIICHHMANKMNNQQNVLPQRCHQESNGMVRAGKKRCCRQDSETSGRFRALLRRCSDGLTMFSCYLHLSLIKLTAQSNITLASILRACCDTVRWPFSLCSFVNIYYICLLCFFLGLCWRLSSGSALPPQ